MDSENHELHEKQARANALRIALRQTQDESIAHLENLVCAMYATLSAANKSKVQAELSNIERLSPEVLKTVQLELLEGEISQRQKWRNELATLTAELESAQSAEDHKGG